MSWEPINGDIFEEVAPRDLNGHDDNDHYDYYTRQYILSSLYVYV